MTSERERLSRSESKEDLIDAIRSALGVEPSGVRLAITALSHPDVIDETLKYFKEIDVKHMCLIYSYPWNCVRETEAKFETIRQDIAGAGLSGDFDELWCRPCRERATDDV